jgi:hypothetical protein
MISNRFNWVVSDHALVRCAQRVGCSVESAKDTVMKLIRLAVPENEAALEDVQLAGEIWVSTDGYRFLARRAGKKTRVIITIFPPAGAPAGRW